MKSKNTLTHIIEVALSNCSSIISGVLIGLLLPKIISVDDYGLYKTFTLYLTYVGFFSLGIIDGIVLDYGGYNLEELNKPLFRCFWRWYSLIHLFFCVAIIGFSFCLSNSDYRFIFLMLAINMMANNFTGYFQQLSQITQRFGEYSYRKVLQSVGNIIIVCLLYAVVKGGLSVNYRVYVICIVGLNVLLTIWYFGTYKDLIVGEALRMADTRGQIFHLMKIGFPLLFANLCSTLILTLDRQFVNTLFDNTTYAIYAFAYNLLSLVTVATSAISTVLYPILKRSNEDTLKRMYEKLVEVILVFVFAALLVYFPLSIFIDFYLPKYHDSLVIFRIIFPGLAISTSITVIMHNYYKTMGKNIIYFRKSLVTLGFSALANYIAYLIFKTTIAISIASIITMGLWYLFVEEYFVKIYAVKWKKNFLYMIFMMVSFYTITSIASFWLSMVAYFIAWLVITFVFFHGTKNDILELIKGR